MFGFFKKKICSHEFYIEDIALSGIVPLQKPARDDYFGWKKYFSEIYSHPSVTKRVTCVCFKCGGRSFADCGLNLDGKLKQRK